MYLMKCCILQFRNFNGTSKNSDTRGVCEGDTGSAVLFNFILTPVPWFYCNTVEHNHILIWEMTNPNKQKALLISPGFDATLSELNKASCCSATMCALVYFCMVGFAKVFLLLILSCEWELSCAVLCWISNALHLSFWISGLFNMRPGNERPAPNVHFTSPVRCCVAAKALKL